MRYSCAWYDAVLKMTLFIARPWTITNLDKPVGGHRLTTVSIKYLLNSFFASLIVGTDGPLTIVEFFQFTL